MAPVIAKFSKDVGVWVAVLRYLGKWRLFSGKEIRYIFQPHISDPNGGILKFCITKRNDLVIQNLLKNIYKATEGNSGETFFHVNACR